MFARFPIALSFVSFAVLAVATPGYCGGIPPPETVTSTVTSTVFQTTTVPAQTITTTKTETVGGTGTCTTTAPAESGTGSPQNCSTGPIQCCESLESASSLPSKIILGLLGIVLQDLEVLLGLNCSPINVIGVGSGDACSAVTVCCENNAIGGLISIGCLPIIL